MKRIFVDSYYYVALLNPADSFHRAAHAMAGDIASCEFWTTELVLIEVANAFGSHKLRPRIPEYIRSVQNSTTNVVALTDEVIDLALTLYAAKPNSEWSLTDCLSFEIMRREQIVDALTGDRHFAEAGLNPLLESSDDH